MFMMILWPVKSSTDMQIPTINLPEKMEYKIVSSTHTEVAVFNTNFPMEFWR